MAEDRYEYVQPGGGSEQYEYYPPGRTETPSAPSKPFHPGQLLDTLVGAAGEAGGELLGALAAPGQLARKGVEALGLQDVKVPALTVPTGPGIERPSATLGDVAEAGATLAFPFAGASRLGRVFARAPRVEPAMPMPEAPFSAVRPQDVRPEAIPMPETTMRVPTGRMVPGPAPSGPGVGKPAATADVLTKAGDIAGQTTYTDIPSGQLRPQQRIIPKLTTSEAVSQGQQEAATTLTNLLKDVQADFRQESLKQYRGIPEVNQYDPAFGPGPAVKALDDVGPVSREEGMNVKAWMWDRVFLSGATDTMKRLGPEGQRLGAVIEYAYDASEGRLAELFTSLDNELTRIFGRINDYSLTHWNPFRIAGMQTFYKITPAEKANLVDVLYTGGRIQPLNDKVADAAKVYYAHTAQISGHPGVRNLTVRHHDGTLSPVGPPSMFFPQQPVAEKLRELLSDRSLRALYNASNKDLPYEAWAQRFRSFYHRPNLEGKMERFPGIENAREFDASALGNPSEVLGRFGYETDPLRAFFRFGTGALRRGELAMAEPEINALQTALVTKLSASGEYFPSWASNWVMQLVNRVKDPRSTYGDVDHTVNSLLARARSWNDATLLSTSSTFSSMNQIVYALTRASALDVVKAAVKGRGFGPALDANAVVAKAGGLHSVMLGELSAPATAVGRAAQGLLRLRGFTPQDRWGRAVATLIGDEYFTRLARTLLKNPANKGVRAQIAELHINPDELLQRGFDAPGVVNEQYRLRAAQVFSNQTMGRTGVQGLPLFMTNEHAASKLLLQYKKFLGANAAELSRSIVRAQVPLATKAARVAKFLVAGEAVGEATRDVTYVLTNWESPFQEKRTPTFLREAVGHAGVARVIDNLVFAAASVYGSLAMGALQGDVGMLVEQLAGPTLTGAAEAIIDPAMFAARRFGPPGTPHMLREHRKAELAFQRRIEQMTPRLPQVQ